MKKRYEALYVGPNMLDGYWDNKTNQYLDDDTIIDLLNKEDYDSIWEKRCSSLYEEKEKMQRRLWKCNNNLRKIKKEGKQRICSKSLYKF